MKLNFSVRSIIGSSLLLLTFTISGVSQNGNQSVVRFQDQPAAVKKASRKADEGDIQGAIAILDRLIEKGEHLFEAYKERSYLRRRKLKDIDGAIADLSKALEIKPDEDVLHAIRAKYKKRTDPQGAIRDLESWKRLKPNSLRPYHSIAEIKAELKDLDGAVSELKAALLIAPMDIFIHKGIARFLLQKGDEARSIAHLQDFLDRYVSEAKGNLPKIKGEVVKKNVPAELGIQDDEGKPLVRRYSKFPIVHGSMAEWQEHQNTVDEARALSEAFMLLGRMYTGRNELDKAMLNLNTASEIDPNAEEAYALRGLIYLSRDEYEKSIEELSRAIKLADSPTFYVNRGVAYLYLRNEKKARSDFDKFLELMPSGKAYLDERVNEVKQRQSAAATPKD